MTVMPDDSQESPALPALLAARRRYLELRAGLPCDNELDIDLHAELTAVIRVLDGKIVRLAPSDARS